MIENVAFISRAIALVGSIAILIYGLRLEKTQPDKHQLVLFALLAMLWSLSALGEFFWQFEREEIRRIYKVNQIFIGGASAGAFLSLCVTGGVKRLFKTNKRASKV
jgi:hypothetical protein